MQAERRLNPSVLNVCQRSFLQEERSCLFILGLLAPGTVRGKWGQSHTLKNVYYTIHKCITMLNVEDTLK